VARLAGIAEVAMKASQGSRDASEKLGVFIYWQDARRHHDYFMMDVMRWPSEPTPQQAATLPETGGFAGSGQSVCQVDEEGLPESCFKKMKFSKSFPAHLPVSGGSTRSVGVGSESHCVYQRQVIQFESVTKTRRASDF
jgi:hypothetical protein